VKLGATVAAYYEDFYGPLADDINAGDESDRCLASWQLDRPRAVAITTSAEVRDRGGVDVLTEGSAGEPCVVSSSDDASVLLCQLPTDIVSLRLTAPSVAREWRLALRSVLAPVLRAGGEVSTVTRDGTLVVRQA
jgi:predicted GNAT superfamily acetyltransferase